MPKIIFYCAILDKRFDIKGRVLKFQSIFFYITAETKIKVSIMNSKIDPDPFNKVINLIYQILEESKYDPYYEVKSHIHRIKQKLAENILVPQLDGHWASIGSGTGANEKKYMHSNLDLKITCVEPDDTCKFNDGEKIELRHFKTYEEMVNVHGNEINLIFDWPEDGRYIPAILNNGKHKKVAFVVTDMNDDGMKLNYFADTWYSGGIETHKFLYMVTGRNPQDARRASKEVMFYNPCDFEPPIITAKYKCIFMSEELPMLKYPRVYILERE